jgi:hypothetical protein
MLGVMASVAPIRETVERYVQLQLQHHPMADPRVQQRLEELQIHCPEIDLACERRTSHAVYWYNLHLVIVNGARFMSASAS